MRSGPGPEDTGSTGVPTGPNGRFSSRVRGSASFRHFVSDTSGILVPKSYLRTMDNRTESAPQKAVARYKIDLSMWDRLGNKTSLQVLFDRAP